MTEIEITSGRVNEMIDPVLHIWGLDVAMYLFLGGLAAGAPRHFALPLDFLGAGRYQVNVWRDAPESERDPNRLTVETLSLQPSDSLQLRLASDGGFVARLSPSSR